MKAILVIDMPKGCCECNCAIDLCHGTIPSQEWYDKRPSWCPLKPIPSFKAVDLNDTRDVVMFCHGYNTCLDEILGETE